MVDQIRVVQFETPAGAGAISVTHPDITEPFSCAILLFSNSNTDSADNTNASLGIGFVTANANSVVANSTVSPTAAHGTTAASITGTFFEEANACLLAGTLPTGITFTTTIQGISAGAIPGGVSLNFTTVTNRTKGVAILFAGLADSCIEEIAATTGAPSAISCPSAAGGTFRPKLVVFTPTDQPGGSAVTEAEAQIGLGFAIDDGTPTQKCAFINWDDAVATTDGDGVVRSDSGFGWIDFATRAFWRGNVTSFSATGYNVQSVTGNVRAHALAISFSGNVRVALANLAVAAATGRQLFNAYGFTPDVVLGMSTLFTSEDTTTDGANAGAYGWFVTGRHGSRAYTAHFQEGITGSGGTPTQAHTRQEDVALLTYQNAATAVVQRATWDGATGSGGFALDFSVGDAAGLLTTLGIQLIPSAPLPLRRRRPLRARARYRRRVVHVQGVPAPVDSNPFGRVLRAILRMRRKALARLRWRPAPPLSIMPEGLPADAEGSKARVWSPGLVRGRVERALGTGRVFSPGLVRGRITGAGVAPPDIP